MKRVFVSSLCCAMGLGSAVDAREPSTGSPPITAIAIDETQRIAIVGSQAGLVLHEWPHLSVVKNLPTRLENIHDISIAPDRSLLAVAGGSPNESGIVELYHWPSGVLWKSVAEHSDLVHSVSWREDSRILATASADKSIRLFDREKAVCIQVLEGHSRPVLAAEFLPDNFGLVTAAVDESLRLWDENALTTKPAVPRRTLTNHTRPVYDLALRPQHRDSPPVVASVGEDNTVRLWQPTVGRMMRFAKLESAPLAVCWSVDGKNLLASCKDGTVCVIDPDTIEITAKQKAINGPAYSIACSSDGSVLVGGANGSLRRLERIENNRSDDKSSYGRVELIRDRWGIPHIFSDSDEGAMYGLGQASAEDRGFQMYYNLRQIQGRLAEILGAQILGDRALREDGFTAIDQDRRMRTIGFYRAAKSVAEKLDEKTQRLLRAYSKGVDDWFESNPAKSHPFFQKYGLIREPWTPADCIASHWFLAQFFAGDGLDDLAAYRDLLLQKPGPPAANFIVDDTAAIVKRKDVSEAWVQQVQQYHASRSNIKNAQNLGPEGPKFSHAWVVGGRKTDSGKSVLVGDPQTPILNPSLFYEFHVSGASINARGIGAPGTPGIMIGWTEKFAWSVTALGADQADLFRLKTDPQYPDQYFVDDQWKPMSVWEEIIQVRGAAPLVLKLRSTQFGPVVSSIANRLEGEPEVALRRVPLSVTDNETIQGLLGLMSANNLRDFTSALAYWTFPSTNLVFGDRDGNIGYWLQAGIPARSPWDEHNGQASTDGSQSKYDWSGLIPHQLLPHVINPSDGWIASGNHRAIESFYPIRIGSGKGSTGHTMRSFRLYELLEQKNQFRSRDVLDIHFDMTNPARRDVVRSAFYLRDKQKAKLSPEALSALAALEEWNAKGCQLDLRIPGTALASQIPIEFRAHTTPLANEFGGGQAGLGKWLKDLKKRLEHDESARLSENEIRLIDSAMAAGWNRSVSAYGPNSDSWNAKASAESQKNVRSYMGHLNNLAGLDKAFDMSTPDLFCIDGTTIRSQGSQAYTQYVPFDDLDNAMSLLPPGNSERLDSPWRTATSELWIRGELHPAPISRVGVERVSSSAVVQLN